MSGRGATKGVRFTDRDRAMAKAYRTGAYSMQAIAEHFRVGRMTVSRAVPRQGPRRSESRYELILAEQDQDTASWCARRLARLRVNQPLHGIKLPGMVVLESHKAPSDAEMIGGKVLR
jgi:IS30 family transposase